MIIIRFCDDQSKRRGLGFLAGRYSCKSWSTGETIVAEQALVALAYEAIRFSVEGRATYKHLIPSIQNPFAKHAENG